MLFLFNAAMWKFLYPLASPKVFFHKIEFILPVIAFMALIFLLVGLTWGLFIAPPDYQQGDAYRILYVHVPAAFLSLFLYGLMAFFAFVLLVWRIKIAGILLISTAEMGFLMALIALVTGSIWGKPMWGTWWIWDARLTSEFILLLLYAAILATSSAFQQKGSQDKMVAILTLIGVVDLPIIHYSVYWWNTLHQGATFSLLAKPKIAPVMLFPLLLTLTGFFLYAFWALLSKSLNHLLMRECHQRWVKDLIEER